MWKIKKIYSFLNEASKTNYPKLKNSVITNVLPLIYEYGLIVSIIEINQLSILYQLYL